MRRSEKDCTRNIVTYLLLPTAAIFQSQETGAQEPDDGSSDAAPDGAGAGAGDGAQEDGAGVGDSTPTAAAPTPMKKRSPRRRPHQRP